MEEKNSNISYIYIRNIKLKIRAGDKASKDQKYQSI